MLHQQTIDGAVLIESVAAMCGPPVCLAVDLDLREDEVASPYDSASDADRILELWSQGAPQKMWQEQVLERAVGRFVSERCT